MTPHPPLKCQVRTWQGDAATPHVQRLTFTVEGVLKRQLPAAVPRSAPTRDRDPNPESGKKKRFSA
eukprot:682207-Hanusia_phi.AAC.1